MVPAEEGLNALREIIGIGKWQIIQYLFLTGFYFAWAVNLFGILIYGFVPDFACLPPTTMVNDSSFSNISMDLTYGQSCEWHNPSDNTSQTCSGGFVYAEPKEASIVSEAVGVYLSALYDLCFIICDDSAFRMFIVSLRTGWNLVCGKTFLVDLSQTILYVGTTIGIIVFTPIADKFGRRKVVVWSHFGFIVTILANCFTNNITVFIVLRFFIGTMLSATVFVGWVVTLELFTAKHRTTAALVSNIIWSVSTCFTPALGYLMKGLNWRYVQLAMCSFCIVIVGQYIFVDETLKWLIANGRLKAATKIIKKAAKMNGVKSEKIVATLKRYFPEQLEKVEIAEEGLVDNHVSTGTDKPEVSTGECAVTADDTGTAFISKMAIFRHRRLRSVYLIMSLAWFTNALTYVGLYMLATTMSGNRYLNLFLSTIAEVVAAVVLFPIAVRCGRRKVILGFHVLGGVSLITASVLYVTTDGRTQYIALTCAVIVSKFSISGTFNLIFMYTIEVFPTNIRSFGFGLTALAGRLGEFMSPFTATLARELPWMPAAVFGGFCLLVALASPLLPETRGKPLPQTLEDLDKLYSDDTNGIEMPVNGTGDTSLMIKI